MLTDVFLLILHETKILPMLFFYKSGSCISFVLVHYIVVNATNGFLKTVKSMMINTHNQSIVIVVVIVISVVYVNKQLCAHTYKKMFCKFLSGVREGFFYVKTIITWELGICFCFLQLQEKLGPKQVLYHKICYK